MRVYGISQRKLATACGFRPSYASEILSLTLGKSFTSEATARIDRAISELVAPIQIAAE